MSRNERPGDGQPPRGNDDRPPNDGADRPIALGELGIANRLGEIGIGGARERLEGMNSFEGAVETGRAMSGFVGWSNLYCTFGLEERLVCKVPLPGGPYGYALVLFPEASADAAAAAMLAGMEADPDDELVRSTLLELGAMVINAFFDAWADTFDLRIDVGVPTFVRNTERDVIRGVLQGEYELGVYLGATLALPTHGVHADVYVFPENGTFAEILDRLSMEMVTT